MGTTNFDLGETKYFTPAPEITDRYVFNNRNVPRVTEIIESCMYEPYITQWANRLGLRGKNYDSTLKYYADYGTTVHEALEQYIKTGKVPKDVPMNPINAFENWWSQLKSNNSVEVIGQEFKLTCQYYGGTYDMLLNINGTPWLVDFKTSTHISFRYMLQMAAYRYMLKERSIVKELGGVIILRLFKDRPQFEEFVLDFNRDLDLTFMDNCERMFNAMAYTYWWRNYLSSEFELIHKQNKERSK